MILRTTFAILFMLHLDPELGTTDCTQQHQSLLHPERAVPTRKESRILREHDFEEMIEIQVGLIGLICTHVPLYLVPLPLMTRTILSHFPTLTQRPILSEHPLPFQSEAAGTNPSSEDQHHLQLHQEPPSPHLRIAHTAVEIAMNFKSKKNCLGHSHK